MSDLKLASQFPEMKTKRLKRLEVEIITKEPKQTLSIVKNLLPVYFFPFAESCQVSITFPLLNGRKLIKLSQMT